MNYSANISLSLSTLTRKIDVLSDIHDDIAGASQTLCNMATCAADNMIIEPQQLALLGEVLQFAADALGDVIISMNDEHDTAQAIKSE